MKKTAIGSLLLLAGVALGGCPIYSHDANRCETSFDCADGYSCDSASGACVASYSTQCSVPSECAQNETCNRDGVCAVGDCSFSSIGCVAGYSCQRHMGVWECVSGATSGSGGAPSAAGGAPGVGGAAGEGTNGGAGAGGA